MSRVRDIRAFVAGRREMKIHRYIVRSHFADIEAMGFFVLLELLALVL